MEKRWKENCHRYINIEANILSHQQFEVLWMVVKDGPVDSSESTDVHLL